MPDLKISQLTSATTPLAGTEVLPIVQSSTTVKVAVSDLTAGRSVSASALTASSGNLTFSGTAQRITGDFSNATLANRLAFQTSTADGNTVIQALPNGTGLTSGINFFNSSTPTNCGQLNAFINASEVRLSSSIQGTGTYLPMTFYTGGSERVRVDTSGNVGIGTGSPNGKLEVSNSAATHTVFQLSQTNISYNTDLFFYNAANITSNTIVSKRTDGGLWLYQSGADYIAAYTNGSERMRIDSSGNVGIGDTSPSSRGRFSVLATTGAGRQFVVTGAGLTQARFDDNNLLNVLSLQNYGITAASQGVGILWSLGDSSANANDAGSIQVGSEGTWGATAASRDSFMRFSTTLDGNINERMRIDSSGNVGIGTTSPSKKLDVFNSGTTTTDLIVRNGTVSLLSFVDAGAGYTGTTTNHPLLITTNNTERMRIDSSGNVGIGTTSFGASSQVVLAIANATAVPTGNPTGGGVLYVEAGALKYRGSSGTVTTIANA